MGVVHTREIDKQIWVKFDECMKLVRERDAEILQLKVKLNLTLKALEHYSGVSNEPIRGDNGVHN